MRKAKSAYLTEKDLRKLLNKKKLVIRPFLEDDQINGLSVDFRLGTDFLVSIQGRRPYINASKDIESGDHSSFFQETRRKLGETIILHPFQTILASSLEYIKLPADITATIYMRSTYSRTGLMISSILQPGYSGCISLELTNTSRNPIQLKVGARLFQAVFSRISTNLDYFSRPRKYMCQVRPQPFNFMDDKELEKLEYIAPIS